MSVQFSWKSYWGRPMMALALCATVISGCAHRPWERVRRDQAQSFTAEKAEKTDAALKGDAPLDLERCLALALENNTAVRGAALKQRIAKLERRIAFANFLPALELESTATRWEQTPKTRIGIITATMTDRDVREEALKMQMPILAPATWYLYALHQKGEDAAVIAGEWVRQQVALQTTTAYYTALAQQSMQPMLQSQLQAAEALLKQVNSLVNEGAATPAQRAQAELLVDTRRFQVDQNERDRQQALAVLLAAMGLSPYADARLAESAPLTPPEESLEALAAQALLKHPGLRMADRTTAIAEDQVKLALTAFLPSLGGFVSRTHTSSSLAVIPTTTLTGLAGVLTLFDGFANVNAYRAARVKAEAAFVQREELCFTILVGLSRAYAAVEQTRQARLLADKACQTAKTQLSEADAQWREGVLDGASRLSALASVDAAEWNRMQAGYLEQIALATLRQAVGNGYIGGAGAKPSK